MMTFRLSLIFGLLILFCSCDALLQIADSASSIPVGAPTKDEISRGIREALIVGTQNTVEKTSQLNGFYNNPLIRIPFPPEAQKAEQTVRSLGLDKQVDQFVKTLNRGAEEASKKATPIFISAIKQMTLRDVYDIWQGENNAATRYLRNTTERRLKREFRPVIKEALDKVELTRYWNPVVSTYNKIPLVDKVNPNLDEYVLTETLDGLFLVIAQEEAKIREDPVARVSEILRKVFGYNR